MKIRFLIKSTALLLMIHSNLLGQIPAGYLEVEYTIVPMDQQAESLSHPHIPASVRHGQEDKNAQVTSTNWSGYAAETNLNNPTQGSVSAVYGSWVVPVIKAGNGNDYCVIWVGIDGYSNGTVEQIGTAHNWVNGSVQNYAWFEMYPEGSYTIKGFPVNAGDVMSASVVYLGNNIFTMTLYNDTQKVVVNVPMGYTTSSTAQRASAEWIVEAPYSHGVLPLADFGTAYRWGCQATINDVTAPINTTAWQSTAIEMVTNNGTPKAIPSALLQDGGSFFDQWEHR